MAQHLSLDEAIKSWRLYADRLERQLYHDPHNIALRREFDKAKQEVGHLKQHHPIHRQLQENYIQQQASLSNQKSHEIEIGELKDIIRRRESDIQQNQKIILDIEREDKVSRGLINDLKRKLLAPNSDQSHQSLLRQLDKIIAENETMHAHIESLRQSNSHSKGQVEDYLLIIQHVQDNYFTLLAQHKQLKLKFDELNYRLEKAQHGTHYYDNGPKSGSTSPNSSVYSSAYTSLNV